MTSSEIQAFITVYECRNITEAAKRLFITQSTLSTKIRKLEETVGTKLFQRGKGRRVLIPTYKGEMFYDLALRYRAIEEKMLHLGDDAIRESLRVATVNSIGTYLMTPVYERFTSEYPDIALELVDANTDQFSSKDDFDGTDLGLYMGNISTPEVRSFPFLSEPMLFLCNKNSFYPATVKVEDLDPGDEVYIDWTQEFYWWHRSKFTRSARYVFSIMNQLEYFLMYENRWALVPSTAAYNLTKNEEIVTRNISFEVPPRVTSCIYLRQTEKEDMIRCFLECMRETIRDMGCDVEFL